MKLSLISTGKPLSINEYIHKSKIINNKSTNHPTKQPKQNPSIFRKGLQNIRLQKLCGKKNTYILIVNLLLILKNEPWLHLDFIKESNHS